MAPRMANLPTQRGAIARGILVDVVALAGASLLAYGAWLAYEPAGFMVGGLVLLAAGVNGARQ